MKRISILTVVLAVLLAGSAHAQFFGQLGPLGPRASSGLEEFGGYLGFGTGTSIAGTGMLRLGMGEKMDLGLQGGVQKMSNSGPTSVGGQVDLKLDLLHPSQSNNLFRVGGDLAFSLSHSGGTTIQTYHLVNYELVAVDTTLGGGTMWVLDAIPAVSIGTPIGSSQMLYGWGGFGVAIGHSSGSTNTAGALRLGGEFDFTKTLGLVAEFNDRFQSGGSASSFMVGVTLFKSGSHAASTSTTTKKAAPAPAAKKAKGK